MKIGIVGTRHKIDEKEIFMLIKGSIYIYAYFEIVSGGCPTGIDKFAKEFAKRYKLKYTEFNPNDEEGKSFGEKCYKRDVKIAEYSTLLYAFPCKHSEGTFITIKEFEKLDKIPTIHNIKCL